MALLVTTCKLETTHVDGNQVFFSYMFVFINTNIITLISIEYIHFQALIKFGRPLMLGNFFMICDFVFYCIGNNYVIVGSNSHENLTH
jgi:hypothetical protein